MTVNHAFKVLKENNVQWKDYLDLVGIYTNNIYLKNAIERVKTYITQGV